MDQSQSESAPNGSRHYLNKSKMWHFMSSNSFNNPPPNTHSSKTMNPNKAVFTIDANTGKIFIVNNKACQLLGYTSNELRSKSFFDLLNSKLESHISALAEMQIDSEEGIVVLLSGKVIEMKTKYNSKIVVSLWIRQIDNDGRNIAVAEPVQRYICQVGIDRLGIITSADATTATIFLFDTVEEMIGKSITTLIPYIKLPDPECKQLSKSLRKQRATGRTTDCVKFPLCLVIAPNEANNTSDGGGGAGGCGATAPGTTAYNITIWVFQNLSGLIIVDDTGNIRTCNQPFSLLMFGYSQEKITNMNISAILPNFGKDLQDDKSPNVSNTSITSNEWELDSDPFILDNESSLQSNKKSSISNKPMRESSLGDLTNDIAIATSHKSLNDPICTPSANANANANKCKLLDVDPDTTDCVADDILTPVNMANEFPSQPTKPLDDSQDVDRDMSKNTDAIDSIASSLSSRLLSCTDGSYIGEAIHADGTIIDVLYSVSIQELPCSTRVYCIWVCRDPNTRFDNDRYTNLTLTFNSMASTVEQSLGQVIKTTAAQNSSRPNSLTLMSKYEDELYSGEYSKHYTSIHQIGKGAYGFVKMAFRNSDRLLVITKFILKEKLCSQFMVKNNDGNDIPIEIHLLQTLNHPNIVSLLDMFENELFYQLVMEKHGSGMDLFEFIERRPQIDEKLGSYIFRQIADAINYLHEQKILHRDIKDENIIIDQNFRIKLIDFGSATFMEEGKYYSTFYGTTEYCSPEVLAGNKYAGPELEMWSLGVTLYVLMFFENPFLDVEETLKSDVHIPSKVSDQLRRLLESMLNKDPRFRCTMRQLLNDPWVIQDVNAAQFNFSWIVPCKPHEANPEIYYSGQLYSSTSVLSTISPQESFSQIDEVSMEGSDEDEKSLTHMCANDDNHHHLQQDQDERIEKKGTNENNDCTVSLSPRKDHLEVRLDVGNKLSISKSENDIFQDNLVASGSVFNVVSLHNVNIKEPTLNCHLGDLSNLHISHDGCNLQYNKK